MRTIRNKTIFLLCLLHASVSSFAVDIYLAPAPTGNDANNGSSGLPVATLAKAYSLITDNTSGNPANNTIHVSGFIDIMAEAAQPVSLSAKKYCTIQGNNPDTDGFDGKNSAALINLAGNYGAITFKNLTFKNANAAAGAIANIVNSGTHVFDHCKFHDNKNLNNNNSGNLHFFNSNTTFIDCEFYNNQGARGGVMWMNNNAVVSIKNCHFHHNTATVQAGAIWQYGNAVCTIESSLIEDHDISANATVGGAIAITNPNGFTIDNCIIRNNKSKNQGGAIYIVNSNNTDKSVVIKNSLIADNVSTNSHGGGIYIANTVAGSTLDVSFINTTIFRNKTLVTGYGGGLFVEGAQPNGSLKFINCTVVENETQGNGGHCGGINIRGADQNISVYVYNSIFEDNFAATGGTYSDFWFSGGTGDIQQGELGTNAFISNSFFSTTIGNLTGSIAANNIVNYGTTHRSGLALPHADYIASQNSIPIEFDGEALEYGNAQYLKALNINTDQLGHTRAFKDGKCAAGAVERHASFGTLYTVTVESDGDNPSPPTKYTAGQTATINAGTTPTGYHFVNWTSDPTVNFLPSTDASTTFRMPAKAVTATAHFELLYYAATVVSASGNATGSDDYTYNQTVSINAGTAPTGTRFTHWTADPQVDFEDATDPETFFPMPPSAVTVTAHYESIYKVTVSSISGNATGESEYAAGETVTIDAGTTPQHQQFTHWTAEPQVDFDDATDAETFFPMPSSAVTVTAHYAPLYPVAVVSSAVDATGDGEYLENQTVTITAGTAPTETRFTHWTADSDEVTFDTDTDATSTFPMPAVAVTITAHFGTLYSVTVNAGSGSTGSDDYLAGQTVTITAGTAPAGTRFTHWTADPQVDFTADTDATTTFSMPATLVIVTAHFEPLYTATIVSDGNGATGSGDYLAGQTVAIHAGSLSDHRFIRWTATPTLTFDKATQATTRFTMPALPITVTAHFARLYTVRIPTSANGKVTADNAPAIAGETVTLRLAPDNGYEPHTIEVRLTASPQTPIAVSGQGSTRTFVMPEGAVTVSASFQKTPDRLKLEEAVEKIETATLIVDQQTINNQPDALTWLIDTLNIIIKETGITVPERNVWMYQFTTAVAGTKDRPEGRDGTFAASVSLSKNGVYATLYAYGTIRATIYVPPVSIDTPSTSRPNAYLQNGTLHLSGLTAGESWSVHHVSGQLIHRQMATGNEALLPLTVRGAYIVLTGHHALKIVY
jgi:Zn-finger protein